MDLVSDLADKYEQLLPHLDERQQRLYLAAEARALGLGGVATVAKAARSSETRIYRGLEDLEKGEVMRSRTRRPGAGRPRAEEANEDLKRDLRRLVEPETRGDPESPLCWTTKSTRKLAAALRDLGHDVKSHNTVARLLREMGFSLQANRKTREGTDHPDRDAQFQHVNEQVKVHQAAGHPVVSMDCKKKELVGNFKNGGQEWMPKGKPEEVNMHDFPDPELGKAVPYGVYDVARNEGFVNVGCSRETSAFAVESVRRWWHTMGREVYPTSSEILICVDGGGSNGYRRRQWKVELARWARAEGLTLHVCHLPPGTSKWNKIEHRLFSHISMNWRGRPLTSYEVVVQLIASTTTSAGLQVQATLDSTAYPRTPISDEEMSAVPISRNDFHGEWNYTIHPVQLE